MSDQKTEFPSAARLLDAGGWFKPWPRATHVVDLMPYETRRGQLQLTPLAGEHFTKETWMQVDFLQSGMLLPYPDDYFDYAFCGHTIEDLENPEPLLRELARVARTACIETPSRLAEQTTGVRDRICDEQGYSHHHWIVDLTCGVLELSPKSDSLPPTARDHRVPLSIYERELASDPLRAVTRGLWHGNLTWRFVTPDAARKRARDFACGLPVTPAALRRDRLIRSLRGLKRKCFYPAPQVTEKWWEHMLTLSQPYSALPLCSKSL